MESDSSRPSGGDPSAAVVDVELRPVDEPAFSAIVSLRGEHDLASAPNVSEAIAAIDGNVLVDLTACTFLDSTIIGVLIRGSKELEREGHYLEVVAPPANADVARTLDTVRLRDLVVIHPARPSAQAD